MLSDKLIPSETQTSNSDETYEPQSYQCNSLDKTFACGFVIVITIVSVTLYVAINFPLY